MELHVYEYKLPLTVPFQISGKEVKERHGLIFEYIDDTGTYFSEAAPLQSFSSETVDELVDILKSGLKLKKKIRQQTLCCLDDETPPSLKFAISALWFQHSAKIKNQSLGHFLKKNRYRKVDINTTLGLGFANDIIARLETSVKQGYNTVKLKVGKNQQEEVEAVREIRKAFPTLKIRLDANQAWEPKVALECLNEFEPYTIEYCEQPISRDSIEAFAWLKQKTNVKIAADESVRTYQDAQTLIKYNLVDLLILKPMFIGSIEAFNSITRAAKIAGMEVTVTTSLESGIGRRLVASLASTVLFSPYAHGLATGSFFQKDLLSDEHRIQNGTYLTESPEDDFPDLDRSMLNHILTL